MPQPEPPNAEDRTKILRPGGGAGASTDFTVAHEPLGSFGGYELLEEVGSGGMGVVYKAKHKSLGTIVALKTIRDAATATDWDAQRFRKEALAAAHLDHPNIVPVKEFGDVDGQMYFTMAFVDGDGLDARLRQGPLDNRHAAAVVRKVAEAVAYAHEMGVVHRDLKPANVMLDREGTVKVTDFGIARRLTVDDSDAPDPADRAPRRVLAGTLFRLTAAGTVLGTPGYMAPEQAMDASRAGPAADIWALGAILYACLTGRAPFLGANAIETMTLAAETEPVPPEDLNPAADPALVEICLKCLQKSPGERYHSAADVAAELTRWRQDRPRKSPWPAWRKRAARWFADAPELVPLLAGLAVHRLGNIQEGLFVGFALAGIRLAAPRPSPVAPSVAAAANALFLFTFFVLGSFADTRTDSFAYVASAAGMVAGAITLGCGWAILDARLGSWSPRRVTGICLAAGLVGLALAAALYLGGDRLRDLGDPWPRRVAPLDHHLGRVASWFLAVPLGLAVGALIGKAKRLLGGRPWPVLIGATVAVILFAWVLREIRPDGVVETARFPFLGPGAALAVAEGQAARSVAPVPDTRWAAVAGIYWLKVLLFVGPMVAGAALAGLIAEMIRPREKPLGRAA
jgi:hypothetical protein